MIISNHVAGMFADIDVLSDNIKRDASCTLDFCFLSKNKWTWSSNEIPVSVPTKKTNLDSFHSLDNKLHDIDITRNIEVTGVNPFT